MVWFCLQRLILCDRIVQYIMDCPMLIKRHYDALLHALHRACTGMHPNIRLMFQSRGMMRDYFHTKICFFCKWLFWLGFQLNIPFYGSGWAQAFKSGSFQPHWKVKPWSNRDSPLNPPGNETNPFFPLTFFPFLALVWGVKPTSPSTITVAVSLSLTLPADPILSLLNLLHAALLWSRLFFWDFIGLQVSRLMTQIPIT